MIEAEFKHGNYLGIGEFYLYGKDAQLFGVE